MALEALGKKKIKTLKHLHQLKLALDGCKPGPNCMERMILFEVLSMFLSVKHILERISVHAEIMLAVINYPTPTLQPLLLNPRCLSWGVGKTPRLGNSLLLRTVHLLPKHRARGNPTPLSGWVPKLCTPLFSPSSSCLVDPAHIKCSLRMEQGPRLLSRCCV